MLERHQGDKKNIQGIQKVAQHAETLRNVKRRFVRRIDASIDENGAQYEHLL